MADVQQQAGIASGPSVVATIRDDAERRAVWLILMAAVAWLVAVGVGFRPR